MTLSCLSTCVDLVCSYDELVEHVSLQFSNSVCNTMDGLDQCLVLAGGPFANKDRSVEDDLSYG